MLMQECPAIAYMEPALIMLKVIEVEVGSYVTVSLKRSCLIKLNDHVQHIYSFINTYAQDHDFA